MRKNRVQVLFISPQRQITAAQTEKGINLSASSLPQTLCVKNERLIDAR